MILESKIEYTPNEFKLNVLNESDTVIDIGGYTGHFTQQALEAGAGKVVVFEPNSENFEQLKNNISNNEKVSAHNLAVWSKDDLIISFTNTGRTSTAFTDESAHRVQTVSLDTILNEHDRVRLVKITAQGAEYPIILSSKNLNKITEIIGEVNIFDLEKTSFPLSWRKDCDPQHFFEHLQLSGFNLSVEKTDNPNIMKFSASNLNVAS